MVHLWVRAEQRPHEERVGLTPEGAAALVAAGIKVSVEESHNRAIPIDSYLRAGCQIVAENSWPFAPQDAIIFGLKELPEDGDSLHMDWFPRLLYRTRTYMESRPRLGFVYRNHVLGHCLGLVCLRKQCWLLNLECLRDNE